MPKRVLIVNDIPGAGKVAANINIPILSAGGLEVSVLPTMIVSTQTGESYKEVARHELNQDFKRMLDVWEHNEIYFDVFLTGYFSTSEQVELFADFYQKQKAHNPKTILLMDPIMADGGKFYPGFDQTIAREFSQLMQYADVVFPNITEACLLTNTSYKIPMPEAVLEQMAKKLLKTGVKHVVITGAQYPAQPDKIGFYYKGETGESESILHAYYPEHFFGTGDLVISVATVFYSRGGEMSQILEQTGYFIEGVLEDTKALKRELKYGLYFEPSLKYLLPIERNR